MLRDQTPVATQCDTASLKRNVEYGQRMKITGTPTTLLPDGTRVPGAIDMAQLEKLLAKQ